MFNQDQKIALFEEKIIRRLGHNDEWYFSVVDVVEALTNSLNQENIEAF